MSLSILNHIVCVVEVAKILGRQSMLAILDIFCLCLEVALNLELDDTNNSSSFQEGFFVSKMTAALSPTRI